MAENNGQERGLINYRVYLLGQDGQIAAKEFSCASDQEAAKQAKQYLDGCDIELWRREQFVTRLTKG
jgi:hypothetical protein